VNFCCLVIFLPSLFHRRKGLFHRKKGFYTSAIGKIHGPPPATATIYRWCILSLENEEATRRSSSCRHEKAVPIRQGPKFVWIDRNLWLWLVSILVFPAPKSSLSLIIIFRESVDWFLFDFSYFVIESLQTSVGTSTLGLWCCCCYCITARMQDDIGSVSLIPCWIADNCFVLFKSNVQIQTSNNTNFYCALFGVLLAQCTQLPSYFTLRTGTVVLVP
jgi:hypothetical protein